MKKLLTTSCSLLSACSLYAESAWFATIEIESLQSLQTGIEAFAKAAQIPLPPDGIPNLATLFFEEALPLASPATAVSFKDPIRIFLLEDTEKPIRQGGEPLAIVDFTLPGEAKALQDQLAKIYGTRRDADNVITFNTPNDHFGPDNLLLSIRDQKALLATSKEAFDWFQKQQKLDSFLPPAGKQTVKACANLKQLISTLDIPPMPRGEANPAIAILNDFEYLSLALTPTDQALTVSYGLRAKAGSVIANLLNEVKPPEAALWNGLPANAIFGYVGQQSFQEDAVKIVKAYLGQDIPLDPIHAKLEQTYTRDLIRYLAPTADKKAFRIIDLNPLTDVATAKELIKTLDQGEKAVGLKKEPSREIGGLTIERYSMTADPTALRGMMAPAGMVMNPANLAPGGNPALDPVMAILSALTKGLVIECTIKDNYFLSAIGPADATDDWIPTLPFPANAATLDKKVAALDAAAKPLLAAGELNITPFLRQLISMMPNVKPEHLALFSAKTDAVQFWTTRTADNTTVASFRVPANEVAAMVKVAQNGQVLQELINTFFMTRIMPMMMQGGGGGPGGGRGGPAIPPPPNF